MDEKERTFFMIKPEGVQRGLVGKIIERLEERGYKLVALKQLVGTREQFEVHYSHHKGQPYLPAYLDHMVSGPVVAMVWQGLDVVKQGRTMLGVTDPLASAPGTIRGDYAIHFGRSVCHGSDSIVAAEKEIALWFKEDEINDY